MKRTASIATVFVAAVLIGGGGYSALATGGTDRHGGGPEYRPSATASPAPASSPSSASLTAAQVAAAARKAYPGTVVEVELDGDHPGLWEVHIVGADGVRREVRVDSRTGAVTLDRRGGDDGPGDDHGVHTGGDDRVGHDAGDDRGRGTGGQDDAPGDDHGVHATGDDHLNVGDDHAGDDGGRGRGRHRGGHGGDDH
ncbi:PepSY domain-containing protein [Streptomyces sp. NBC_00328]|uniref:PepSY domain-containing protein n=1 Tax=Streptomyces sp. NBC_00328 TaxID=2903646 RepID=UPI002E2CB11C|nr:PepSY domain-containing protein [Streptomyces sp. NBC_00328]